MPPAARVSRPRMERVWALLQRTRVLYARALVGRGWAGRLGAFFGGQVRGMTAARHPTHAPPRRSPAQCAALWYSVHLTSRSGTGPPPPAPERFGRRPGLGRR